MTDKELLQLAAKSADIKIEWHGEQDPWCFAEIHPGIKWNPLTDDGDALRLAVKLGIKVFSPEHIEYENDFDIYAAVRRYIVRRAAALGA